MSVRVVFVAVIVCACVAMVPERTLNRPSQWAVGKMKSNLNCVCLIQEKIY